MTNHTKTTNKSQVKQKSGNRKRSPDLSTCYHEAGHAVAAVILQIPISTTDVYKKTYQTFPVRIGRFGICRVKKGFYKKHIEGMNESERKHTMWEWKKRLDLMSAAGPCAQARFDGINPYESGGEDHDFKTINKSYIKTPDAVLNLNADLDTMKNLSIGKTLKGGLVSHSLIGAIRLLDEPGVWSAVEEVAEHLHNFYKIYPETVKAIVGEMISNQEMKEIRKIYTGRFDRPFRC